jgi:hypothetical protein
LSGPPLTLNALVRYGCTNPWIFTGSNGTVPVAILGSASFDVTTIDTSSLSFAGATPISTDYSDVNLDGFLDLSLNVKQSSTNLTTGNTSAAVTGFLLDGRPFVAPARVLVSSGAQPGGHCPNP